MILYVPSSAAKALSEALWALTVPPNLRGPNDTSRMFSWIDDLQVPSKRWLIVDTEFTIPIHQDAVLNGIADILQPWIDDGQLPSDTNDKLSAYIENARGKSLVVYNAFPQLFKDMSKTKQEMISAGYLSSPSL